MSTWGALKTDIRADLKDDSSSPRWSDSSLYVWAKDAIRDFSLHFPRELSAELTVSNGAYPLPDRYMDDRFLTCPDSRYLERRITQPGIKYKSLFNNPTLYWIEETNLYLNGEPSAEDVVTLYYLAYHTIPASASDDDFVLTIPEYDEELIRLFVKAKANEQIRTKQSNLDRFRPGTSNRSDNPLEPEVENLMDEYFRRIAERYPGGAIRLYRTGRRYR